LELCGASLLKKWFQKGLTLFFFPFFDDKVSKDYAGSLGSIQLVVTPLGVILLDLWI